MRGGAQLPGQWTIREVLNWTRGYFEGAGIIQPRLEAEILLAHALDVDRLQLYISPDKPLSTDERTRYRMVIQKRKSGIPLQHLVGEVSFFGLRFKVGRDALIPRPETEELLERALKLAPRDRRIRCVDLGTGAGVIAVCLARYIPDADVTALDISPAALRLAEENARAHGVEERILFLESDWLNGVDGRFDLIVSNPPYVPTGSIDGLASEVRDHEPRTALDGGPTGLERIEAIVHGVRERMAEGGVLLLEIGDGQAEQARTLVEAAGLVDPVVERDVAGVDRFVIARCP